METFEKTFVWPELFEASMIAAAEQSGPLNAIITDECLPVFCTVRKVDVRTAPKKEVHLEITEKAEGIKTEGKLPFYEILRLSCILNE